MRNFINIVTEKEDRWAALERKYGTMLAQHYLTMDDFKHLDPSPMKVQWLLRSYSREPFGLDARQIHVYMSLPNTGDIMSYATFADFASKCEEILAKRKQKDEVIHKSGDFALTVKMSSGAERFDLYKNKKIIGKFLVDLSRREEGLASVHSEIAKPYRRMGLGTMVYNWVEQYVAKQGLKLTASQNLSTASFAFWQKRDPSSVAGRDPDHVYRGYDGDY